MTLTILFSAAATLKNDVLFEFSGPARPAPKEPETLGKRKREEDNEVANDAKRAAIGNGAVPTASNSKTLDGIIELDDDETAVDEDGRTVKVWVLEDD
jgi:hypothetical protein